MLLVLVGGRLGHACLPKMGLGSAGGAGRGRSNWRVGGNVGRLCDSTQKIGVVVSGAWSEPRETRKRGGEQAAGEEVLSKCVYGEFRLFRSDAGRWTGGESVFGWWRVLSFFCPPSLHLLLFKREAGFGAKSCPQQASSTSLARLGRQGSTSHNPRASLFFGKTHTAARARDRKTQNSTTPEQNNSKEFRVLGGVHPPSSTHTRNNKR